MDDIGPSSTQLILMKSAFGTIIVLFYFLMESGVGESLQLDYPLGWKLGVYISFPPEEKTSFM